MIPKDLRKFLFVYCHECGQCYESVYDRYTQQFRCPECYEEVKYEDVMDELRFDTRQFVAFLKEQKQKVIVKRLLSLYMDMEKRDDVPEEHESIKWIQSTHYAFQRSMMP